MLPSRQARAAILPAGCSSAGDITSMIGSLLYRLLHATNNAVQKVSLLLPITVHGRSGRCYQGFTRVLPKIADSFIEFADRMIIEMAGLAIISANGRRFLYDGDIFYDITGFSANIPAGAYQEYILMYARTPLLPKKPS